MLLFGWHWCYNFISKDELLKLAKQYLCRLKEKLYYNYPIFGGNYLYSYLNLHYHS